MVSAESAPAVMPLYRQLAQMVWGSMLTQALHVTARLGVVDVLRDGPKTAGEVAAATHAHPAAVARLLRFLTAVDVLAEDGDGRFSATALGDLLRSDHPQSARALAMMYGSPFCWRAWGDLYETVKRGGPAFDRVHGESFFDHFGHDADDAAIFNAAMTSLSTVDLPVVLDAYDFSGFAKIVDIGGGHGALLRGILERCPNATGVLADVPSVLATSALAGSVVGGRCEAVATDMFASVPAGGDAYVLKRILHDWSDAESSRILRNCRRAIAPHGKLLVMDAVVMPSNRPDPAKWMDLNMMVLLTGRERTEREFAELYASAGFRLTRVIPAGRLSIVEGAPA